MATGNDLLIDGAFRALSCFAHGLGRLSLRRRTTAIHAFIAEPPRDDTLGRVRRDLGRSSIEGLGFGSPWRAGWGTVRGRALAHPFKRPSLHCFALFWGCVFEQFSGRLTHVLGATLGLARLGLIARETIKYLLQSLAPASTFTHRTLRRIA